MQSTDAPIARTYLGVAFAALIAFAVTIGGTFVFDDVAVILQDPRIASVSLWPGYFTATYNDGVDNLFRPLTSLALAGQYLMHGTTAWPFHLVNILLHSGVSVLVAVLTRRLGGSALAAGVAGILFAVHPVHTEAVALIVGRAETMAALGFLGAVILFLRQPLTPARAVAIWACALASVLSKEQGLMVPAVLPLLAWCVPRDWKAEKTGRQTLLLLICFSFAGYIIFRESKPVFKFEWERGFLDWSIQPMVRSERADRWLMPFVLLGHYARLLVAPWRLSLDYGGYVIGYRVRADDPYLYVGIATATAWATGIAWAFLSRRGVAFFLLVSTLIVYAVVANALTLIGTNFGERLIYLPSAFLCVGVGLLAQRWARRPAAVWAVVGTVALLGLVRTVSYAARWNDRLHFYERSLAEQPRSTRLAMLLAWEQRKLGDLPAARRTLDRARDETPDYWDVWRFSAIVALEQCDGPAAKEFLDRAHEIKPELPLGNLPNEIDELLKK